MLVMLSDIFASMKTDIDVGVIPSWINETTLAGVADDVVRPACSDDDV